MYNGVILYILGWRRPPQWRIANLGGGQQGYGKVDTHWELNPTRGIFIPYQILLYHGPIYEVLLVLQLM